MTRANSPITPADLMVLDRRTMLASAAALVAWPAWARRRPGPDLDAAFDYAYPLFEFCRAMLRIGATAVPGAPLADRLNHIFHRRILSNDTSRQVTAPNNDTMYSSCFMELSGGPVVLRVPDITDRYFSVALMNAFTDNFFYVGTRATHGRGGTYWIVGPDWHGTAPAGTTLVRSDTNDVWMLVRILIAGQHEVETVQRLQDQFRLDLPPARGPTRPPVTNAVDGTDGAQVVNAANEMLGRSRRLVGQATRWRHFERAGIRPGGPDSFDSLPPALQAAWRANAPRSIARLRETFTAGVRRINGWAASTAVIGEFGDNDRIRAAVALSGLAALGSQEAMYFSSLLDSHGDPLTPTKTYRIRIPPEGVPVDGFWSITMYAAEPDGRYFFAPNPLNRYSVSERTPGLIRRPDGAIDIILSRTPVDSSLGNWLPTPDGPMRVSLRAYIPREPIRQGRWSPPSIEVLS